MSFGGHSLKPAKSIPHKWRASKPLDSKHVNKRSSPELQESVSPSALTEAQSYSSISSVTVDHPKSIKRDLGKRLRNYQPSRSRHSELSTTTGRPIIPLANRQMSTFSARDAVVTAGGLSMTDMGKVPVFGGRI